MKISRDTLFLSGIIIISFSIILFQISPLYTEANNFKESVSFFGYFLSQNLVGVFGIIVGCLFVWKSLKKK